MRRNLGPEIYIDNKIIPTDAYVIYPFSDVHLDPDLYPDPWQFDPDRKEVTHASFAYVGWGGGEELASFLIFDLWKLMLGLMIHRQDDLSRYSASQSRA